MDEFAWHWIAWTKDQERIADCGVVWARTTDIALERATLCVAGPYAADVCSIDVREIHRSDRQSREGHMELKKDE